MKTRSIITSAVVAVCILDLSVSNASFASIALSNFLALPLALLLDQSLQRYKWKWQVLTALIAACGLMSFLPVQVKLSLRPVLFMVLACLCLFVTFSQRLAQPRALFKNSSVWNGVEDLSRSLLTTIYVCAVTLSVLPHVSAWIAAVLLALLVIVYDVRYVMTGHCFLVPEDKEKLIKNIAKGDLRGPQIYEDSVGNKKMNALYERALAYMDEHSPYLDEFFSLEDFSRKLYTNKVYLSRTINVYSGRNFRQFVNFYRVKYSIELMRRDSRLKVDELATMSGFHSNVSYNMAFRLFMNETPKEWMMSHRKELSEGFKTSPAGREGSSDVNL